jgi:hypothetical protein
VSALKHVRCSGSYEPFRLSPAAWDMLGLERTELKKIILLADEEIKRADTLLEAILKNAR